MGDNQEPHPQGVVLSTDRTSRLLADILCVVFVSDELPFQRIPHQIVSSIPNDFLSLEQRKIIGILLLIFSCLTTVLSQCIYSQLQITYVRRL